MEYKITTVFFTRLGFRDDISKILHHFIGSFRFTFLTTAINSILRPQYFMEKVFLSFLFSF